MAPTEREAAQDAPWEYPHTTVADHSQQSSCPWLATTRCACPRELVKHPLQDRSRRFQPVGRTVAELLVVRGHLVWCCEFLGPLASLQLWLEIWRVVWEAELPAV